MKEYGRNRGSVDCPCCPDAQTDKSRKKTARQKAKKEIEVDKNE